MGGAWKVAYADLVTGLFALFMCLWLTSVDEDVMEEISKYFRNPNTVMKQATPGIIDTKNANVASSRKAMFSKPALIPKNLVRKTTEDIEKSFVQSSEFLENKNMLEVWLSKNKQFSQNGDAYAVYWNGPFVPGFFKRSEVHIPIIKAPKINKFLRK